MRFRARLNGPLDANSLKSLRPGKARRKGVRRFG